MPNQRQDPTRTNSVLYRMGNEIKRRMSSLITSPVPPATGSSPPTPGRLEEGPGKEAVASPVVESHARGPAPKGQVGAVATEQWWRERYNEIAERGYQLRPRYRPDWHPSSLKSGKDSVTEDSKLTLVRYYVWL